MLTFYILIHTVMFNLIVQVTSHFGFAVFTDFHPHLLVMTRANDLPLISRQMSEGILLPKGITPSHILVGMQEECCRSDLRWVNIFNRHLAVRRPPDPPDRQMAYAKPARNRGLVHILGWAEFMLAQIQAFSQYATGPKLRLSTVGYIRTGSEEVQAWHRDVPEEHEGVALSIFTPVNCVCPADDPSASLWQPFAGGPTQPMGCEPGDVFVMDSRVVHRGGGRPQCAPTAHRVVAFAAVVEAGRPAPDYGRSVPAGLRENGKR